MPPTNFFEDGPSYSEKQLDDSSDSDLQVTQEPVAPSVRSVPLSFTGNSASSHWNVPQQIQKKQGSRFSSSIGPLPSSPLPHSALALQSSQPSDIFLKPPGMENDKLEYHYITPSGNKSMLKDDAYIEFDVKSVLYKIEYPARQHLLAKEMVVIPEAEAAAIPDSLGLLYGFLRDADALDLAPGVSPEKRLVPIAGSSKAETKGQNVAGERPHRAGSESLPRPQKSAAVMHPPQSSLAFNPRVQQYIPQSVQQHIPQSVLTNHAINVGASSSKNNESFAPIVRAIPTPHP